MARAIGNLENSIARIEQDHKECLRKTDQLYDAMTNLRFEGKAAFGRNINDVKKILDFFDGNFVPHMKLESIIFSYLETHIPRLESIIKILRAEHNELKVNLEVLQFLIDELLKEKNEFKHTQTIEKLKDKTTYFIYLLRNHIQAEDESIYRIIDQGLHEDEKRELLKKIRESDEWKCISKLCTTIT